MVDRARHAFVRALGTFAQIPLGIRAVPSNHQYLTGQSLPVVYNP